MFEELSAPFPPDRISWRVGSTNKDKTRGMALAYIDARDVMDRLDAVCGPSGWQCDYPHANGKTVCRVGIKIGDEWIWKADGAGDTDFEAEKGALSDAFKRAAVRWGIGRYLYDAGSPWVEIEAAGRSFAIKDSEKTRLAKTLDVPTKSAVSTKAIEWGRAVKACKGLTDIVSLKLGENFEAFWRDANAVDRKHVTDIAEARKAAILKEHDAADVLSPQDLRMAG